MFLRKNYSDKTGRTHLAIVQGYRSNDGKNRHKTIRKVGYLDELEKQYDDPVAYFTALAKKMDDERKEEKNITINFDTQGRIDKNETHRKNFGYVVYSKIYHELEIDAYLKNARRHELFKYNTDSIMRLLVYTRLLQPESKRASVLGKERFFENFKFSLHDVYDALTHFDAVSGALLQHLHEQVVNRYDRKTDLVYYDVTNYYFETDKQDELRRKGPSKENRRSPIVQMGLLIDSAGLPIIYKLFPGNTHDSQTLMPMLTELKKKYGVRRIVTVADKGLNSGDNIAYSTILNDGYIYSKSVRGASAAFKQWILDGDGYRDKGDKYRMKSKLVPDVEIGITINADDGRKVKKKVALEQKWVAFYSGKYAERAKAKRDEAVAKALKLMKNPSKYRRTFDYGAAGYIVNLKIDKESGEVANIKDTLVLDTARIAEEELFDGYYALVTSELDDSDEHIIDMYHGLWRIEESFKVTKGVLGTRPVFLRTDAHINAHFLICFIALLISRVIEMRLGYRFSIARITDSLQQVACSYLDQNFWLFDYVDEVTDELNRVFGFDFGRRVMAVRDIKNILAGSKIG